jgi:hypothetical protein
VNTIADQEFLDLLNVPQWQIDTINTKYPNLENSLLVIYNNSITSSYYKNGITTVLEENKIDNIYYLTHSLIDGLDSKYIQIVEENQLVRFTILKLATKAKITDGSIMPYFTPSKIFITPNNFIPKNKSIELPDININKLQKYLIQNPVYPTILDITIIISVRNVPIEYLQTCLSSLYNQTSNKWNAIIIYDNFSYNCPLVIHDRFKNRVNEYHSKEWLGVVEVNKKALEMCSSELVGFLDSDDALENTAIEKVLNMYEQHYRERIFVYTVKN